MSKMTLYGIWLSGPTYKAGLALSLMGQAFAYKHVDLRAGAHKQPDYLAVNRYGQVPALVDGDLKLCQSGSILIYLADKFGKMGGKTEEIFDGCMMVKAGSVELLIWSPLAYQLEYKALEIMAPQNLPVIVGAAIAIERSRPLQALLRANNVPFALTEGDRVLIAPEQSGGLMLEFMPQT